MGSVEAGIGLALVAAVTANLASLLKHRGCQGVPPVEIRAPLQGARRLARSRWFAAGWGLAAAAWLVHVAALTMAPISLVQAILAGGAVTLAVLSQGLFGNSVERRQWLALGLGGAGLVLLVLTLPSFSGSHSSFGLGAFLAFEGGLGLLAFALAFGHQSKRFAAHRGSLLAVIAGTLLALAGIAIKALSGESGVALPLLATWVAAIVACGILAQYSTVAALQRGGPIETIGLMGLMANTTQIVGGILVFGDPIAAGPLGASLQAMAFALVCLSALLLPPRDPQVSASLHPASQPAPG